MTKRIVIEHGTPKGYGAELRHGIEPCAPCREAARMRQRARAERMAKMKKRCAVRGCQNAQWARGWCSNHYGHWRAYGDPLGKAGPRPIQHGTRNGAAAHMRRGIPMCDPCLEAKRAADSAWKRKQYAPPPSDYAKRQMSAKYATVSALRKLRHEEREDYDKFLSKEKRRAKHLTFGGREYRALHALGKKHAARFAELRAAA